ncbi:MAG: N-acetyl-1-D-myo-inositol-2-amino-2-deoxy-alpha-D-glucopyranoside deacetylase [Actinomycetota bacterium]|nr:N-acetyl-1-D-myo-inositol-2-amino-2-deoxy-alpha-D-glucopyranoside deacetylase [Actinomycetota bacterium]
MTRLLFVHAHPDDETLTCGVTMAHHVARGDDVHVLTCTLGEEGEVIPSGLAHLEGGPGDPLGPWRRVELRNAMQRLGVEHHVLGEDTAAGAPSRYRDSGMAGRPGAHHPRAFASAPVQQAAAIVAAHVAALRPEVVVTYDPHGGYGHPDHIQTHRVTRAALAGLDPAERPERAFEIRMPHTWAQEDRAWVREHVVPGAHHESTRRRLVLPGVDDPYPVGVVDDTEVSHVVHAPETVETQASALQAHATQLVVYRADQDLPGSVGTPFYALSNQVATRLPGREGFWRVDPGSWAGVPPSSSTGWAEGLTAQ